MKNFKLIIVLVSLLMVSCTNRDGEIIDLINSVKKQNDDLKAQITALKTTTDSALIAVLKVNSLQAITDKKIDLIQTDLKTILSQISSLNIQMNAANADLASIKIKIDALQVKCAELVAQIASLDPGSDLKNGLVAYYPFNGNANDASGNGNNGVVLGATLTTNRFGTSNSSYYFSSQNCSPRIEAIVNTSSITTSITISIWVKQEGVGCALSPRILDFASSPIDGPGQLQWMYGYQNKWGIGHLNSNGISTTDGGRDDKSFSTGPANWTHLIYINDGTNCKFYQDGRLLDVTANLNGRPILARNLTIGRMNHPAFDAFKGNIDDLGVWNRALTSKEIQYLFKNNYQP